ncbi:MAG: MBL fold metallo-hydrolase, partial [Chitinophagaceae bacterium]
MLSVKEFTFSPLYENTYILYNETGDAWIIDPGCYTDEEKRKLGDFIAAKGLKPIALLNTHCHLDHVFGNQWVHMQYGLSLQLHPNEQRVLELSPAAGLMWNMPFETYQGPLHMLQAGEVLPFGEDALEVLFVPGHSPGHVAFYCAKQQFMISGDVLFRESIGRTDLPGGNHAQLIQSIRNVLFTLPEETVVYSGHGMPTTIGHEKR